jgi:hypothetical protein
VVSGAEVADVSSVVVALVAEDEGEADCSEKEVVLEEAVWALPLASSARM